MTEVTLKNPWDKKVMRKLCQEATTQKGIIFAGPFVRYKTLSNFFRIEKRRNGRNYRFVSISRFVEA
jgi:hypothetical protein